MLHGRELGLVHDRLRFAPYVVFLIAVMASRGYFFFHYPLTAIYGDSTSYHAVAAVMMRGDLPDFSIRPPVYPVMLAVLLRVFDSLMAVVIAQCLLSAAGGMAMIWAASQWRSWLALPTSLAMAAFAISAQHLEHDTAIMAESTLTSLIVLGMAWMLAALARPSARCAALSSAAFGLAILAKPAAHFLIVIAALLAAFVVWNRYPRRFAVAFLGPLSLILLGISSYNYAKVGAFTTTTFAESQITFATLTFWDQDPAYPAEINQRIARVQQALQPLLPPDHREVLRTSWDPLTLARIFNQGFSHALLDLVTAKPSGADDYLAMRAWIRTLSFDAIERHPVFYLKFVYTQLATAFGPNIVSQERDFSEYARERAATVYSTAFGDVPNRVRGWPITRQYAAATPAFVVIGDDGRAGIIEGSSLAKDIYYQTFRLRQSVFASRYWVAVFVVVFAAAAYRVLKTRARAAGPFILLMLNLAVLGASLVVALVEVAMPRYGYGMEFVYYLDVALLPMLWLNPAAPAERGVAR